VPACALCGVAIAEPHRHVIEIAEGPRGVRCACGACAILFDRAGSRFRTVPDRVRSDPAFALAPVELGIPVGLAFLVRAGGATLVGYPGPAGITDGELADDAWARLASATPLARDLVDHVEALLVYGERGAQRLACYLVPVTHAYELAARLRERWSGIAGGDAAHADLAAFFATLDRAAARGAR
jgi:hypothetical protein